MQYSYLNQPASIGAVLAKSFELWQKITVILAPIIFFVVVINAYLYFDMFRSEALQPLVDSTSNSVLAHESLCPSGKPV